jgi:putative PIN family toxin of toxin-antitoxin system
MRVVLDTNVIIAAFSARGLCAEVFEVCLEGHDIVISQYILSETKENLLHKFHLPRRVVQEIIEYLRDVTEAVEPEVIDKPVCRDKSDDSIIGTALGGDAVFIITGDKDLLVLKKYKGIKIVTPREFWKHLRG